jgi:hypothetical protein
MKDVQRCEQFGEDVSAGKTAFELDQFPGSQAKVIYIQQDVQQEVD